MAAPNKCLAKNNKSRHGGRPTKAQLADQGGTVLPGSPADFGKLIADETEVGQGDPGRQHQASTPPRNWPRASVIAQGRSIWLRSDTDRGTAVAITKTASLPPTTLSATS
jgi:hypothetical protein